jgi:hypothetical protein
VTKSLENYENKTENPSSFFPDFYPRWYVKYNAGLSFCFVVLVVVLLLLLVGESLIKILLYLPILFNFTLLLSLLKILHYCPISPCIQQPCTAALPVSLARQSFPAGLPGSLARQFDQF